MPSNTENKKKKRSFNSRHPKFRSVAYFMLGIVIVTAIIIPLPLFILPKKILYSLGRGIGLLFVYPAIRGKVQKNLYYAYDEQMTEKKVTAIAKKIAANNIYFILDCY